MLRLKNISTVFVSLLVLCVGLGSVQASSLLLHEEFNGDLSQWDIHKRSGHTVQINSSGGNPGAYLYTNDYLNHGAYISYKQAFDYTGLRMEFSADMQAASAAFADQRTAGMQLVKYVAGGQAGLPNFAYIGLTGSNYSGGQPRNTCYGGFLHLNGGSETWETFNSVPLPVTGNGNAWNNGKIVLRADGFVEFYMNNVLVYSSTNTITQAYSGVGTLQVGGRKSNYDNPMVVLGDPVNQVPEPATLLAGLAGLTGVGRYLRKR